MDDIYAGPDLEEDAFEDPPQVQEEEERKRRHLFLTDDAHNLGIVKLLGISLVIFVVIALILLFTAFLLHRITTMSRDWMDNWGVVSIALTLGALDLVLTWFAMATGTLKVLGWLVTGLLVAAASWVLLMLAVLLRAPM